MKDILHTMPHLQLETKVNQDYKTVFAGFDRKLFDVLLPNFPPVKVLEFDGQRVDGRVGIEMNLFLFKIVWIVRIVSITESLDEIEFVDEGVELPSFLRYWKHRHIVRHNGVSTTIIDDITFYSPYRVLDWLLYPIFWLQFFMRRPIYERFFS